MPWSLLSLSQGQPLAFCRRFSFTETNMNKSIPATVLTAPCIDQSNRADAQPPKAPRPFLGLPSRYLGVNAAAHAKHLAQMAEWKKLDLQQDFADEDQLRSHLRAAGVRITSNFEPATPDRAGQLLKRCKIHGPKIRAAVGTGLTGYLKKNPKLPLWAAVALILKAAAA
jgi:hypothetical protein